MKIASQTERQSSGAVLAKFFQMLQQSLAVISKLRISMRSGDRVGDSIGESGVAHLPGNFPGRCAVINRRQNVAVNVDHKEAVSGKQEQQSAGQTVRRFAENSIVKIKFRPLWV